MLKREGWAVVCKFRSDDGFRMSANTHSRIGDFLPDHCIQVLFEYESDAKLYAEIRRKDNASCEYKVVPTLMVYDTDENELKIQKPQQAEVPSTKGLPF